MAHNYEHAEHDPQTSSKKVTIVSAPTIYAITTGSAGNSGNVTLNPSPNFIGIVTVANPGSAALTGNVTLDPGSRTGIIGNITLSDPKGFIGLVTVVGSLSAAAGNITLDAGSRTGVVGNVTLSDAKTFIGLVTVGGGTLNTVTAVTDITNPIALKGNVTLSDSKTFIGLVTTVVGSPLPTGANFIGLVTVANTVPVTFAGNVTLDAGSRTGILGNVTLSDSKTFIGLTTATLGSSPAFIGIVTVANAQANTGNVTINAGPNQIGSVTVSNIGRTITGNLTLSDAKTFIGLTTSTLGASPAFIGIVTVANPTSFTGNVTLDAGSKTQIIGNITLSDPKGFIGLVTVVGSLSAAAGNITLDPGSRTGIVGNVTLTDSKGFIGLVTVGGGVLNTVTALTDITNPIALKGNLTLSDSKTYVGLVTATLGASTAAIGKLAANSGVDIGDVDVTSLPALPAGANFIGLVTVVGSLSPAAGNVTLDPGSKTGIVGNVTLSDPKGFIGLTTSVIGSPLPAGANYIGLVTIVGSLSAAAGNITLDAGSLTGIKGNLTLTDSKGFIGLVTVVQSSMITVTLGTKLDSTNDSVALGASSAFVGIVTVTNKDRTLTGNVTLSDAKTFIGLVTATLGASPAFVGIVTIANPSAFTGNITLDAGSLTGIRGNITLTDSKGYIGLVSIGGGTLNTITAVTDITNPVAIKGNMTLSDSKTYVGLVTATIGNSPVLGSGVGNIGFATVSNAVAWPDPKTYIGLVTITGALSAAAGNITLDPGSKVQIVGNVTITSGFVELSGGIVDSAHINGNVTLSDAKTFIGLTTSTLGASPAFVGIVTIANSNVRSIAGNLTLSDAKTYIGLVTATSVNGGTNKVLIHKNIAFAQASIVTIAVPSNTFKITHLAINANATVRINIKSGASYLTGNVSLGMNLVPGGGWVENGSPDSPIYIGLAGASAIVVEKLDLTATSAQIGGKLIYFDE